jgi:hypothetical protein
MPDSDLPCDVDQVLADKCRRCHGTPGRNGAPLIFYKWSELHAEYLGEPVYKRLGRAVQTGFMPNPREPSGRAALVRGKADAPRLGGGGRSARILCAAGSEREGGKADESAEPRPRYRE